tara:strand:- start:1863 stop:2723 length:861 start_codon:yes stop_codon:yes gene_type:complete
MKYVRDWVWLFIVVSLMGCSSTQQHQTMLLVTPAEINYRVELTLAKLNEYLNTRSLTLQQKARLLYDRGVLYDSVGLKTLARIDFHQALKIQPTLADAYNFLGIYYTQDQAYRRAFEAFDAALELQPDYQYVYLNRGLASYYNRRYEMALSDLESFYKLNPQDGYRILWVYIAQSQQDPVQARQQLQTLRQNLDDHQWDSKLIDLMLGKISKNEIFIQSSMQLTYRNEMAERMCEVYFYMGKQAQIDQDHLAAIDYFKLALATNVYDFVEHRYARLELYRSYNALE